MKSRDRSMNNGKDILVVEDSATQREQIRHLLESHGFRVTTAADGKKAFKILQSHLPAVVVSDIVMPGMDGFALCKEIKSSDSLRDIPVILLTSLSGPQDVIKGLESGADNFIRKPFEEKYLLSRIDYIIANRKLRKSDKLQMGVELFLGGKRHFITAERQQILDLLISTYEQAVHLNEELKLREKQVTRGNEILKGLYQIAKRLNQAVSEEQMLNEVLEGALGLLELKADWIYLVEGESVFRVAAARSLPEPLNQPGTLAGDCLCRRMLLSGELQRATIMPKCERLAGKDGKQSELDSHVSVPLRAGSRTLGVLNLITNRDMPLTEDDLQTLNGIGNQIGTALERLRVQERLEQLVDERTAALTAEIAERKLSEEELRRMEERYRTTLDHMMEGCQIIGQGFRYLYLNDVAVEHSRNTRGDLLGRTIMDVYPGIESSEMFASLKRCMSERIPLRLEYEFEYPDGLKSWFNLSFEPVPEGVFIL
ncbi:MAG TPA: response regulator, partial [Candidatus Kryptobacter bacterium]|nr:response regulator [Candidatus Kryptobacter bacterium]